MRLKLKSTFTMELLTRSNWCWLCWKSQWCRCFWYARQSATVNDTNGATSSHLCSLYTSLSSWYCSLWTWLRRLFQCFLCWSYWPTTSTSWVFGWFCAICQLSRVALCANEPNSTSSPCTSSMHSSSPWLSSQGSNLDARMRKCTHMWWHGRRSCLSLTTASTSLSTAIKSTSLSPKAAAAPLQS